MTSLISATSTNPAVFSTEPAFLTTLTLTLATQPTAHQSPDTPSTSPSFTQPAEQPFSATFYANLTLRVSTTLFLLSTAYLLGYYLCHRCTRWRRRWGLWEKYDREERMGRWKIEVGESADPSGSQNGSVPASALGSVRGDVAVLTGSGQSEESSGLLGQARMSGVGWDFLG